MCRCLIAICVAFNFKLKENKRINGFFKTESIRKQSNFNFQWKKPLYQNNFKEYCILFDIFQGLSRGKKCQISLELLKHR